MNPKHLLKTMLAIVTVALFVTPAYSQKGEPKLAVPSGEFFFNQQFSIVRYDNIAEISDRVANAKGSVYLNDDWRTGTLYTASGHVLQDAQLKYDIKHDVMEINTPDGVKTLLGKYIKQFEMQEPGQKAIYVSGNESGVANGNHSAFYKVLASAHDLKLLSRTELYLQRSNYSPQFDVGSKNDKLVKKEKLYLSKENNLIQLDKNNYSVFGKHADTVKAFAKDRKLKLQKKEDAVKLLQYYGSLQA